MPQNRDDEEAWSQAALAASRLLQSKTFEDYRIMAHGIATMRRALMAQSGANSEHSVHYRRAYAEWADTHPWAQPFMGPNNKAFRSACFWLDQHIEEVEAWRASLDQVARLRWSSPETVKRQFDIAHRPRPPAHEPRPETQVQRLTRELAEARAEVARLRTADGGSLFVVTGPHPDTPSQMATSLRANVGRHRFEAIRKAINDEWREFYGARTTHAG